MISTLICIWLSKWSVEWSSFNFFRNTIEPLALIRMKKRMKPISQSIGRHWYFLRLKYNSSLRYSHSCCLRPRRFSNTGQHFLPSQAQYLPSPHIWFTRGKWRTFRHLTNVAKNSLRKVSSHLLILLAHIWSRGEFLFFTLFWNRRAFNERIRRLDRENRTVLWAFLFRTAHHTPIDAIFHVAIHHRQLLHSRPGRRFILFDLWRCVSTMNTNAVSIWDQINCCVLHFVLI